MIIIGIRPLLDERNVKKGKFVPESLVKIRPTIKSTPWNQGQGSPYFPNI